MGDFADDLIENDYDDDYLNNLPIMCTGCGELVREDQTRFEDGKTCCIYCKPF